MKYISMSYENSLLYVENHSTPTLQMCCIGLDNIDEKLV